MQTRKTHNSGVGHLSDDFWEPQLNCYLKTVQPGDYAVTGRPDLALGTLLGSCVSACICDPVAAIGGLNHFLLPQNRSDSSETHGAAARYGVHAMEMLINQILKSGGERGRLQAKLFGGANVIALSTANSVGARNQEFSLEFMKREGIPVIATDFGGETARRIFFRPSYNKVLVAVPNKRENARLRREEAELGGRAKATPDTGKVELF